MTSPESQHRSGLTTTSGDYDERYYQTGLGLPYDESEPHWRNFFGHIADNIVRQLRPARVLDVGCAKGFLVQALVERGVDAFGVDISDYAIGTAPAALKDRLGVHDLTQPLQGRWDLITCIEVLEHMAPPDTQRAMDNICAATDRVFFSSTPYDYVEPTHVNLQPTATWVTWFAHRGLFRRVDLDLTYLSPWAMVVERRNLTPADVAHLYETELAPVREELAGKRQALLEAERRVDELLGKGLMLDPGGVDRVLALTDEVIGLRAEMAEAQYCFDQHSEEQVRLQERLEAAEARAAEAERFTDSLLRSVSWRTAQAVARPLHRARRALRNRR